MIPLISHIKSYQITYNAYFINKSHKKWVQVTKLWIQAPSICLSTLRLFITNDNMSIQYQQLQQLSCHRTNKFKK